MVNDESGDLFVGSHNTLMKWKNYYCQLLNVHGVNNVRQVVIRGVQPFVSEPSSFEVEITVGKLKKY
jgi:hypothetical protein